jgi:hypothetical protein
MNFIGSVERLMKEAIDFYVHADPDPYHPRRLDVLDLALQAKEAGMRAVVAKCRHFGTAPLAYLVKIVSGFTLIGSLTLNSEVGGSRERNFSDGQIMPKFFTEFAELIMMICMKWVAKNFSEGSQNA